MDKDRKAIIDRRAKGRAEALGKDKGKSYLLTLVQVSIFSFIRCSLQKLIFSVLPVTHFLWVDFALKELLYSNTRFV